MAKFDQTSVGLHQGYRDPQSGDVNFRINTDGSLNCQNITFGDGTVQTTAGTATPRSAIVGSISDFSPAADGTTDDSAKFTTAQATYNEIWLAPNKSYVIGTNLTLTSALRFVSGAKLVIKTGVTLTLSGRIEAPLTQIFVIQGTGKVVMGTRNTAYEVYPEWWGAVGDWNGTTGTDDTAAIQAAITAVSGAGLGFITVPTATPQTGLGTVVLGPKAYAISSTLTVASSFVGIRGQGQRVSILMMTSASADILSVMGSAGANFVNSVFGGVFSNFAVMRSQAISGTPNGIKIGYAIWCRFDHVEAWDSYHGWDVASGVTSVGDLDFIGCQAVKSLVHSLQAGFFFGSAMNSTHVEKCASSFGTVGAFYLNGSVDIWLSQCNAAPSNVGLYMTGNCGDVIVSDFVSEGGSYPVKCDTVSGTGKIQLINGYYHGNAGIYIHASNFVQVIGGDVTVPNTANGVLIDGASTGNIVSHVCREVCQD